MHDGAVSSHPPLGTARSFELSNAHDAAALSAHLGTARSFELS